MKAVILRRESAIIQPRSFRSRWGGPILNYPKREELVDHPFLGSGTTLAPPETEGAYCCGIELDSK